MPIISDPCACLASKVVRDNVRFSRSILCDSIWSCTAPPSMESVNEWNEVAPSEPTAKVKVMQSLLDITMYSAQRERNNALFMTHAYVFLI